MRMNFVPGGFRRTFGRTLSVACMAALLMTGIAPASADVPLADGTHWVKSGDDVKKAYLLGVANVIQIETAYNADNPAMEKTGFSPRVSKGMQGQTMASVMAALDAWYAANPDRLQRPIIETLWFEIVVPGLKTAK